MDMTISKDKKILSNVEGKRMKIAKKASEIYFTCNFCPSFFDESKSVASQFDVGHVFDGFCVKDMETVIVSVIDRKTVGHVFEVVNVNELDGTKDGMDFGPEYTLEEVLKAAQL